MKRAFGFGVALLLAAQLAYADSVPDLVKMIENQPNDMDRSVWKEKRRDAAKKLAQSKDKAAVPELIKLADSETFDIIGEIAIEGLGSLGDKSAVPTLQKIASDNSREKSQRDLAAKSLKRARLGRRSAGHSHRHSGDAGHAGDAAAREADDRTRDHPGR